MWGPEACRNLTLHFPWKQWFRIHEFSICCDFILWVTGYSYTYDTQEYRESTVSKRPLWEVLASSVQFPAGHLDVPQYCKSNVYKWSCHLSHPPPQNPALLSLIYSLSYSLTWMMTSPLGDLLSKSLPHPNSAEGILLKAPLKKKKLQYSCCKKWKWSGNVSCLVMSDSLRPRGL